MRGVSCARALLQNRTRSIGDMTSRAEIHYARAR